MNSPKSVDAAPSAVAVVSSSSTPAVAVRSLLKIATSGASVSPRVVIPDNSTVAKLVFPVIFKVSTAS